MLTDAQQHATDRFAKSLLALSDDALIDTYQQALDDHRAARAEGSDNLTKAYAQTLATEKAMRSLIIEPATRSGIREPARITIQENMLLATGKAQRFPIHAAIAAASPAETAADLADSPHGGTVMDVGARRYRSAATPRTNSLRRRCNSPSMAAAVVCRNHDMRLRSHAGAVAAV